MQRLVGALQCHPLVCEYQTFRFKVDAIFKIKDRIFGFEGGSRGGNIDNNMGIFIHTWSKRVNLGLITS